MPVHVLHICGVCAIGLMTILAIASTASPWTKAKAEFLGMEITSQQGLWGYKSESPMATQSGKWADTLDNDNPACSGSSTPTQQDVLTRSRIAQAGAILAILGSISFGICGILYAVGKIQRKFSLLIPAIFTWCTAMMCYGGYTSAYNACDKSICESFVDQAMAQGASEASCGPAAGVFLVWAACAAGIGGFVCLLMRTNRANANANANAMGQPINDAQAPYQAYPAQQPQGAYPVQGQVYQAQPYPGQQQQAYPGQQQAYPQQGGYPGQQDQPAPYPGMQQQSNGPCQAA